MPQKQAGALQLPIKLKIHSRSHCKAQEFKWPSSQLDQHAEFFRDFNSPRDRYGTGRKWDKLQNNQNTQNNSANKIDEFALLIRIIKLERVHFLREIHYKQLFIITQKDMFTGDSILHYAIFDNKSELVRQIIDLYENEVNMRNEDGNTPLAYACLRGNLQIVKLLHGKGAIMNQKNQANLTPLMLAIYNSHFFVVHYLLGIESVVESVNSSFDLYRVLQFGISCLSSQIFFLLVEVFTNKIEEMQLRYGFTVWELKFNIQDALLHQQMQDGGRTFDDNSVSQIDQQSNSMMTYRDYGTANGMHQIGYTLLHYACSCGNFDIFEYILQQIQNLGSVLFESENPTKETPLHWAVLKNNYRIVQQLICEYKNVYQISHNNSQLGLVRNNQSSRDTLQQMRKQQQLIMRDNDLYDQDQDKAEMSNNSVSNGRTRFLDIADLLCENGLSTVDVKDMGGDTPLHWSLLVTNNADINKENQNSLTPLHAACLAGSIQVVNFLLDQNADFMKRDKKNFLPLHYAVIKDQADLVRHLQTERHFSVLNKKYYYDSSPPNPQNPLTQSSTSTTLMSLAILNGSYSVIQLLASEWGDNLDVRDSDGNTYLHLAAMSGHVNVFLYFLSKQISISSKNTRGKTAIEVAKIYKQDHLIRYLREHFEESNVIRSIVAEGTNNKGNRTGKKKESKMEVANNLRQR
eukprot:403355547